MPRTVLSAVFLLSAGACARHGPARAPRLDVVIDTVASIATTPMEQPVAAYPLSTGQLAVLDYKARKVLILNAEGGIDTTLGRPGHGPGEIDRASRLVVRGDTLAVLDIGNGRICNFILHKGFVGTRPLPKGFAHQAFVLLPGDTTLHMTDGLDSALVALRAPNGTLLVRYGHPVVPPQTFFHFGRMKEAIAAGRVPDEFKNVVLPIVGPHGDVWLVHETTGRIQHFTVSGTLLGELVLPSEHLQRRTEEFFRDNRQLMKDPARVAMLTVVAGAVAQADGLWVLLAGPDSTPPRLLTIDTTHVIREQFDLHGATGAGILLPDTIPGSFYLIDSGEGTILHLSVRAHAA